MTALTRLWPAAVGLTAAVLVLIFSADRETAAISVSVAVLCYLAAAATGRRWVAWAGIAAFSVVVALSKITGVPWWASFGVLALALIAYGVTLSVPRRPLLAHAGAVLAYGGLAVTALHLPPVAGGVLAGLALAAHAAWDFVLHRRNIIVPRSLTEACLALDIPLGLGVVVLSLTA